MRQIHPNNHQEGGTPKAPPRRKVDILVLSDLHLGTIGCHARELVRYLDSIDPGLVVLNGDIIDMWQFHKYYWPRAHTSVIKRFVGWLEKGRPVYYVTGNHDEMLRKFGEQHLDGFHLVNKLLLDLDGRKAWIFHGDVFDVVTRHSRFITRLGSTGYDLLILLNRLINFVAMKLGRGRISLSKMIKDGVKAAVSHVSRFEEMLAATAVEKGYDYVICGHIHRPEIREISNSGGKTLYLNSGDWIENLTALEYTAGTWSLFRYKDAEDLLPEGAEEPAAREPLSLVELASGAPLFIHAYLPHVHTGP